MTSRTENKTETKTAQTKDGKTTGEGMQACRREKPE